MIIRTLEDLRQADDRSLRSTPWGLGGKMRPEDAAEYQQKVIGSLELSDRVPESTRLSYERLRTIYTYGVLCYDLYTVAGDLARLVTELALRERFVPFYGETVRFTDQQGQPRTVTASRFDDLYKAIRRNDGRLRGWRLNLRSGRERIWFDGHLPSLLRWARSEGLLAGQRDRMRDAPRAWFRNYVAHPSYHLDDPGRAEWAIGDLAHMINRLWGAPSEVPVRREVMAIAWTGDTVYWNRASYFTPRTPPADTTFVIVLADSEDPGLADFDAQYELTYRPCDWLWGPGTWPTAQEWLREHQPTGDQTGTIDRLFLLRYHDSLLDIPRRPAMAATLGQAQQEGTWYLIRADHPFDAFSHLRQFLADVPGHANDGDCQACPVQTVTSGSLRQVLRRCASLGDGVTPRPVPDVRVAMSHMPRYNRILGNGLWDIPPVPANTEVEER